MKPDESYKKIRSLMKQHHEWFQKSIPLIASENVCSPAVREAQMSDFGHRYAEGWPEERVYAGCRYIDQVELMCIDLMKEYFKAGFVDMRPISGVVANLVIYSTFAKAGDLFMPMSIPSGGHISHGPLFAKSGAKIWGSAGAVSRLNVEYMPFDYDLMNLDVEASKKKIKELKPKLVMFGGSVFLFPHPVKELSPVVHEVGGTVAYDAAHVAGLIGAGYFQDPLREGSDVMTMSTHKTFPGPQKGAVILPDGPNLAEHSQLVKSGAFPAATSNHHLHNVAAVAITAAEMLKWGKEYQGKIIETAKALGQALHERGFDVIAESLGFTESHTLLISVVKLKDKVGLGGDIERLLESANIILNRNLLPWDIREGRHYQNPGGIRIGTQEVTRLGMGKSEMETIADFFKELVFDRKSPDLVKEEVSEFREDFKRVHYGFGTLEDAYKYIEVFP